MSVSRAPALTTTGTGTQTASALGDAFSALMQAALPSANSTATAGETGKVSGAAQQADEPAPRARKGTADVPDPNAVAIVLAPPVQILLPTVPSEPAQVGTPGATDQSATPPPSPADPTQQDVAASDMESTANISASQQTVTQPADSLKWLRDALPPALAPSRNAAESQSKAQSPVAPASMTSVPTPAHVSRPALAPVSNSAVLDTTKSLTCDVTQKQETQSGLPHSSLNTTAEIDETPASSRGAVVSLDAFHNLAAGSAALVAPPALGGSGSPAFNAAIVQASVSGQGAPVPSPNLQTSSNDGSSGTQDNAEESTPGQRKAGQGGILAGSTLPESDSRVGMSGWVASTQHASSASAQQTSAESAPRASSGMTNMSFDRITSESSARRLTSALHSDMSFGVQTDAFGKINIQAALHGDQLASQISLEHAHLNASMLATHMPTLEIRLGEKYNLDATVTVRDSGTGTSTNQQPPSQSNSRQSAAGAFSQRPRPLSSSGTSTFTASSGHQQLQERLTTATGRLDLVI